MTSEHLEPWRHLSSNVLFEHPRVRVVEDAVVLPSGQQTNWLRIEDGRDYVKVICVDDMGRVLVARQYNHPTHRVVHELPGGQIYKDEEYAVAARRELQEEIGLYPRHLEQIGSFLSNNRRSDVRCHVFVASDFEQRPTAPDEEEFIAYEWLPVVEIEQQIRAGTLENGVLLAAWTLFRLHDRS